MFLPLSPLFQQRYYVTRLRSLRSDVCVSEHCNISLLLTVPPEAFLYMSVERIFAYYRTLQQLK